MELSNEILALVALVTSALVVPFVNFVKSKWSFDGRKAVWFTFGTSVVFAIIVGLLANVFVIPVSGQLEPQDLVAMVGIVFSIATLIYKNIQPSPKTP